MDFKEFFLQFANPNPSSVLVPFFGEFVPGLNVRKNDVSKDCGEMDRRTMGRQMLQSTLGRRSCFAISPITWHQGRCGGITCDNSAVLD